MFLQGTTSHQRRALVKLAGANVCLAVIAVMACFNAIIAFSLTVTLAAAIIKVYKLDPEPFFLLSLHTIISGLMLHDKLQALAVLVAVALTCLSAGSVQVSSERIAVFLLSMAFSCLLGHVTSILAAIGLIMGIVGIKLRPLRSSTNFVLGLLVLATSVPVNKHATALLTPIMMAVTTAWCLLDRAKSELSYQEYFGSFHNNNYKNSNNNNNSHLALMNGGHLRMSNTTDSLDLHGHTVTGALKLLHQFLKEHEDAYRTNRTGYTRFLKIITGEDGKNHPEDSLNLIKPTVANFLKINKYRYQVNPDRPGILKIDLESHVT